MYCKKSASFPFFADADLAYAAWRRGWGTVFVPEAELYFIEDFSRKGFYHPLPYFITSPKETSKSALYSFFFNLRMKIAWKTNSILFFLWNITSSEFLMYHKAAIKKAFFTGLFKLDFWEIFCIVRARLINSFNKKNLRALCDVKYNDEKILKIVSRTELK